LIEQMIEAARLEDGALMLRPAEADLRDVVSDAVDNARTLADPKHKIRLDMPDKRVPVRMDAERIKTIVSNLISNAVKYSPAGGRVDVDLTARAGIARVSVKDTGVGIAKEDLPVLFTRFGRISTPQTNHLPGTGLGLYLGRQLARLHGGEITVESEPDRGSTFTLHLPLAAQAAPAARPAKPTSTAQRSAPGRR
jgi:two-component system phosphate regulon sensor histidine kinase PhoR